MDFGLSTHLFHGERLSRGHIETIAAQGFGSVEVFATRTHFDYHDRRRIDELGTWLADAGLRAGSMHAPICAGFTGGEWGRPFSNAAGDAARRREAIDETTAAGHAAQALGCELMVLHLGLPRTQPIPPGDNDVGALRRSLEDLAGVAATTRVRLALEVIPNDLSTPDMLLHLLADLDLGDAGVCLDFGHAHLMGGAPEATEALSGHIIATHVHDNGGDGDDHLVPFEGTIDWPAALAAMWKVGYAGRLVFEVADRGDARGVLARTVRARTRLQAILDELTLPISFTDEA
jgi:sugar phosphate isomerase/epimerase